MSGYKNNTAANRDALFGPPKAGSSSGPSHKRDNAANRDALFGSNNSSSNKNKTSPSRPSSSTTSHSKGYNPTKPTLLVSSALAGPAKVAKLKEAEKFRDAAVQAMQKGLFTRPDPLTAANLYRRAADLYGQCAEHRLERLHRIAAADCQMGTGSFPVAAADYTKAAELVQSSNETIERKRKEGNKLWSDASKAWTNAGEGGKAAAALVQAALATLWEDDTTYMDKLALKAIEEAVEAHVPDVINPFAKHRATGKSLYRENIHDNPLPETMALAKDHVIKTPYAHEQLQQLINILARYGEYPSALYATGAASYMLENDGVSTLTLSRSYIKETILQLAMGDPVAAEQSFLNRHVQHDHYLHSRECKLAEELYRSVLNRDEIALDEARSIKGGNKAAMSQLDPELRHLIHQLRITGMARRAAGDTMLTNKAPVVLEEFEDDFHDHDVPCAKTDDDQYDSAKMQTEMDGIMAGLAELDDLGGHSDDNDVGGLNDDDDDDEVDLR